VKWWLLAIPHYLVLGVFLGWGGYAASEVTEGPWAVAFELGLIGVLVLFAAIMLLFANRYPAGIFDFVMGLDRWVARVGAYVLLMRDEYPPFRLDQGGTDAPTATADPALPAVADTTPAAAAPAVPARSTGARVLLIVVGVVAGIVAFGLLAGGCALVAVDRTQRDSDGFLMSPTREFSSPTYAIVSESADIDTDGAEWALDTFLGTVRIRSESTLAVFVGIGPADEVGRFLDGIEHVVVTDLDSTGDPEYTRVPGSGTSPVVIPGEQTFWVASSSGMDETLDWEPEDGDWRVVVMNNDSSRGVAADLSIGAELGSVLWIGIGLLLAGALFAAAAALAITAGVRRRGA
jgi:hypothetical protein